MHLDIFERTTISISSARFMLQPRPARQPPLTPSLS